MPCHSMVSEALFGNFVTTLALLLSNAGSLTLSVDSTTFSFFHFICMVVSANFIFCFVFLVVLYRIVIVFRLVITDCASLSNFLLIRVITPCYVIFFVLLCHPLYGKLI